MNPFDTTGFPARWFCGSAWEDQPWVGWLHIVSDLVIFSAYYAVPIVVMFYVRQRDDLKFPPIFYAFLGLIFFSCGTVHLIEAGIFWWPIYKMSGLMKFATAVVSASGVFLLARVLPSALDLKSGAAFAAVVDERRRTEEMLKHEQFLLRTMLETLPDLIYFKDKDSRFTRVSNSLAKFLGAGSPEKVVGRNDHDFFPTEFADEARADETHLMQSRIPLIGKEEPEHSADGEHVWLSSTKLPLCNETGEVIGLFGLSRDITEQKKAAEVMEIAKEAAEAANRAKSDFLANMSHEIRTPMNAIMGMTELVLDSELTPTQQEYLSIVSESAESLLAVINEILDFSKIEAGKLELSPEDISLRDEVGDTLRSLALRAHSKGIELAWQIHADVPEYFRCDPMRLRQVLVNLVGNSIKFTSVGEVVVEVTLEESLNDASRLHFVISDTGIGIPEDKLSSVFEAFEQADSSTTRQFGGTGLGLAISQRIVMAMKGRIWVESTPGNGSQFHFVIELPHGDAPPDAVSLIDVDLSRTSVVIVDDNKTNRRILTEILQSWNMQVRSASDGPAAIEAIRETLISEKSLPLLISDVHMPDMDGFTLVEEIRKTEDLRDISVIILTSGGHHGDALRCHQLGISAHMMKPVKQLELQQAIIRTLGRQPQSTSPVGETFDNDLSTVEKLNILLVEDGIANQKLAIALLEKWGHLTTLAENGQEAVDAWLAGSFDLILMDVQMPVMDGLEATRKIRELEKHSNTDAHIPIVAMTARAMKGDREKCLSAGMDDYVSKPIRRDELNKAIKPLVSQLRTSSSSDQQPTESTSKETAIATKSIVDWECALSIVNGDDDLLVAVADAATKELGELVPALGDALKVEDARTAQRCAHTIKSTAKTFGATRLIECAQTLESHAATEQLDAAREILSTLTQLAEQMQSELNERITGSNS